MSNHISSWAPITSDRELLFLVAYKPASSQLIYLYRQNTAVGILLRMILALNAIAVTEFGTIASFSKVVNLDRSTLLGGGQTDR